MNPLRIARAVITAVFMAAVVRSTAESVWEEMPALPKGLAGHAVAAQGGTLLVAGGTWWEGDRKVWRDAVLALDPHDQSWREVGNLPQPLGYAGVVGGADEIWLLGGHNADGGRRDVVRCDREGASHVSATLSAAWTFARGARLETEDYFVVRRVHAEAGWEGAFMAVDVESGRERECAPLPNAAWVLPAVAMVGEQIVVAGGARREEATGKIVNQAAIMTFDPAQQTWHHQGDLPVALRGMGAVAVGADLVYLAGGFSDVGGFGDRAWIFNVTSGELTKALALPLAVMPELLRVGDAVYSIGGEDAPRGRSAWVFRASIRSLITERKQHEK